jgi:hypothetical protein
MAFPYKVVTELFVTYVESHYVKGGIHFRDAESQYTKSDTVMRLKLALFLYDV